MLSTIGTTGGACRVEIESVTLLTASRLPSGLVRENRKAMKKTIGRSQTINNWSHSLLALLLLDTKTAMSIVDAQLAKTDDQESCKDSM